MTQHTPAAASTPALQVAGVLRHAVRLLEAGWGPGTETFSLLMLQLTSISEGFDNGTFLVSRPMPSQDEELI